MQLEEIRALVATELTTVENTITELQSNENIPLIHQVIGYITENGGKRLRPLVLLLGAKLFNYQGVEHIELASALEFIHTATLIHDDVVDESELRRGKPTVHKAWSNSTSILIGDFLYSRAFQLLSQNKNPSIINRFARGTTQIAEGEIMQLVNRHKPDLDLDHYLAVLKLKTGQLFEIAAESGAALTNQSEKTLEQLRKYGAHLGLAFQLVDDALDFQANVEELGKNIGDDLAKGSATLPILYAIKQSTPETAQLLSTAIRLGDIEKLPEIQAAIIETGAIDYTLSIAQREVQHAITALSSLPDSAAKNALTALATLSLSRKA